MTIINIYRQLRQRLEQSLPQAVGSNARFIYDEKSSKLYAPDGRFLKQVFCPKALHWNQLIAADGEDRWRGCHQCNERVINLDVANVDEVINDTQELWTQVCIHVSADSENIIFLHDADAPPKPSKTVLTAPGAVVVIKTARAIEDINRAVGLGYWADVRLIEYNGAELQSKLSVGQHRLTGRIATSGDFRAPFPIAPEHDPAYAPRSDDGEEPWHEVIPFQFFYPYFQKVPVAAYLIPRDLPDGTKVVVEDPIEDIVRSRWNQGDTVRAENVSGHINMRRVVIDKVDLPTSSVMG